MLISKSASTDAQHSKFDNMCYSNQEVKRWINIYTDLTEWYVITKSLALGFMGRYCSSGRINGWLTHRDWWREESDDAVQTGHIHAFTLPTSQKLPCSVRQQNKKNITWLSSRNRKTWNSLHLFSSLSTRGVSPPLPFTTDFFLCFYLFFRSSLLWLSLSHLSILTMRRNLL